MVQGEANRERERRRVGVRVFLVCGRIMKENLEPPYIFGGMTPEQKPYNTERSREKADGSEGGAAEAASGEICFDQSGAFTERSDGQRFFWTRGPCFSAWKLAAHLEEKNLFQHTGLGLPRRGPFYKYNITRSKRPSKARSWWWRRRVSPIPSRLLPSSSHQFKIQSLLLPLGDPIVLEQGRWPWLAAAATSSSLLSFSPWLLLLR